VLVSWSLTFRLASIFLILSSPRISFVDPAPCWEMSLVWRPYFSARSRIVPTACWSIVVHHVSVNSKASDFRIELTIGMTLDFKDHLLQSPDSLLASLLRHFLLQVATGPLLELLGPTLRFLRNILWNLLFGLLGCRADTSPCIDITSSGGVLALCCRLLRSLRYVTSFLL
jgi:hypothetical protein